MTNCGREDRLWSRGQVVVERTGCGWDDTRDTVEVTRTVTSVISTEGRNLMSEMNLKRRVYEHKPKMVHGFAGKYNVNK